MFCTRWSLEVDWLRPGSVRGRAGSVRGPFGVRSGSVRGAFGVRAEAVRGPFRVRAGSVRGPFGIRSRGVRASVGVHSGSVWSPFGIHKVFVGNLLEPNNKQPLWGLKRGGERPYWAIEY